MRTTRDVMRLSKYRAGPTKSREKAAALHRSTGCVVVFRVETSRVEQLLIRGLLTIHEQVYRSSREVRRAAHVMFGVVELLVEKGVVAEAEVQPVLDEVYGRLQRSELGRGVGLLVQSGEGSKYDPERTVEVDCEARLPLCKAACCALRPALSAEDLDEGVARWDTGEPYRLRAGAEGSCVHLAGPRQCGSYAQRPRACRSFTCAIDSRIWKDFEGRIPNSAGIAALRARVVPAPGARRKAMVSIVRDAEGRGGTRDG